MTKDKRAWLLGLKAAWAETDGARFHYTGITDEGIDRLIAELEFAWNNIAALGEHEQQTHEELGAILGTDTSLLDGAKRLQAEVERLGKLEHDVYACATEPTKGAAAIAQNIRLATRAEAAEKRVAELEADFHSVWGSLDKTAVQKLAAEGRIAELGAEVERLMVLATRYNDETIAAEKRVEEMHNHWVEAIADKHYQRRHRKWALKEARAGRAVEAVLKEMCSRKDDRCYAAEADRDRLSQRVKVLEEELRQVIATAIEEDV